MNTFKYLQLLSFIIPWLIVNSSSAGYTKVTEDLLCTDSLINRLNSHFNADNPIFLNPIPNTHGAPLFEHLKAEHIIPAYDQLLHELEKRINIIVQEPTRPNYSNTIEPLHLLDSYFPALRALTYVHLNLLVDVKFIAKYQKYKSVADQHIQKLFSNIKLVTKIKQVTVSEDDSHYKKKIAMIYRLLNITEEAKKTPFFSAQRTVDNINFKISQLSNKFSAHIQEAEDNLEFYFANAQKLAGLPKLFLKLANNAAKSRNKNGYLIQYTSPTYDAVIAYAHDPATRQLLFDARANLCSVKGMPFYNGDLAIKILKLRKRAAIIYGSPSFAQLKTKNSPTSSMKLLKFHLAEYHILAKHEIAKIQNYAYSLGLQKKLVSADLEYYKRLYIQNRYNISLTTLDNIFPLNSVLTGIFELLTALYDIEFRERFDVQVYHDSVRVFEVKAPTRDGGSVVRALLYLDLLKRSGKVEQCMFCETQAPANDIVRSAFTKTPSHNFIVANLSNPAVGADTYLSYQDILNLLHEFGHFTDSDSLLIERSPDIQLNSHLEYTAASELPAIFMEQFVGSYSVLKSFSSKKELSHDYFERLRQAAKIERLFSIYGTLKLSYLDLKLHSVNPKEIGSLQQFEAGALQYLTLFPKQTYIPISPRMIAIFSGSYESQIQGYYLATAMAIKAYLPFKYTEPHSKQFSLLGHKYRDSVIRPGYLVAPLKKVIHFTKDEFTETNLLDLMREDPVSLDDTDI